MNASQPALGARVRAIRAARLIDGSGAPAVRDALVALDDAGRIVFAGSAADPAAPDVRGLDPAVLLDAPGGTVLPGLVDTHVHLTFGVDPMPDARPGGSTNAAQVRQIKEDGGAARALRALNAAQAALAAGVTTVRDCGAKGRAIFVLRDLISSGVLVGPRVLASGAPITTRNGHCWWLGGEADTLEETVARVRTLVKQGADFIKVMATGGNMTRGSNTMAAQYPTETLAAIVADAHRLGRLVAAHAHGVEGIARCAAAGIDMIEHCSWQRPGGSAVDPEIAGELARVGTYVGDTVGGSAELAWRGVTPDALSPGSAARIRLFADLRQRGVRVVTSSDAMYPTKPFEHFPWGVVATSLYGGLVPEQAVHAATGLAADAIGLAGEIGRLAPGRRADVLVVDGDVTADVRTLAQPRWVLRDGIVLAAGGAVWPAGLPGWVPTPAARAV
ncbi:MAG: amidohydrolase family protein [Chloroflexi bacterium]|nr:amidohydrolase family protein [Chloroflexota bacterium]